ncbi:MAG: sarcosine oxidase subunit gamma [Pikeienuella sp.]
MSDQGIAPVSSLNGITFDAPNARIEEMGAVGMITLRGDFTSAVFADAVKAAAGVGLPDVRRFNASATGGLGWMSPDELLWVLPYADAQQAAADLSAALAGEHHMAVNVSDARAMFRVTGAGARELIAKGAPVDMSPDAFAVGEFRRSHIGQIAAAFWADEAGLTVVCFRSLGHYLFDWLTASAKDGATPGVY